MKKIHGFTLIELMIVLTLVAILASVAVPSYSELVKNNRLTAQINEFSRSLVMARSEAVKRGNNMIVCISSDQASCTTGNWEDGWVLLVDADNDGTGDELLLVQGELEGSGSTLRAVSGSDSYTFNNRGFIQPTMNGEETFVLCDDRGASYLKAVYLSNTGRLSKRTDTSGLSCP